MVDLPVATRLVLRDQLRADPGMVVSAAIDDLIARGVWRLQRRWLRPALLLRADGARLDDVPEPLPSVDRMLSRAMRETGSSELRRAAAWIARRDGSGPRAAVKRAVDDALESGLLVREPRGLSAWVVPSAAAREATEGLPERMKHANLRTLGFAFGRAADIGAVWVAGWSDGVGDFVSGGHAGHHGGGHDGSTGHHGGGDGGGGHGGGHG